MTLTYIFHNGFALEAGRAILLFDDWLDSANVMRMFVQKEKERMAWPCMFGTVKRDYL